MNRVEQTPRYATSKQINIASVTTNVSQETAITNCLSDKLSSESMVRSFAEIEPKPVEWLWDNMIPKGKLTLIQGDPASTKTYSSLKIAADVSAGRTLPGNKCSRGPEHVLVQNGEDGYADTLVPRLIMLNATRERIHFIDESEARLTLAEIEKWENAVNESGAAMLIIDPLTLYLGDKIDMNRANAVRSILTKLADLAEKFNIAVVVVVHLNKSGKKALYRSLGSIDIAAIARSILMIGENQNKPGERLIVQLKNSLGPKSQSVAFELNSEGGIDWKGFVDATEEDLIQPRKDKSQGDTSALGKAKEFLLGILQSGPASSIDIENLACDEGISTKTLSRARDVLKQAGVIHSRKNQSGWSWSLKEIPDSAEDQVGDQVDRSEECLDIKDGQESQLCH